MSTKTKTVVIGAGPVGALAAIYAAQRGNDVEVYELRNGKHHEFILLNVSLSK
jgi:flavin-dependent dehydrogenase